MVQCFHPECNHHSERDGVKMFYFPNPEKKKEYKRWLDLIRYVPYCLFLLCCVIRHVGSAFLSRNFRLKESELTVVAELF